MKSIRFKYYNSDKWDSSKYQIEVDLNKSIFENYKDFYEKIPKRLVNVESSLSMENPDYCNYGTNSKDCYLCQIPVMSEKCMYSFTPLYSTYDNDSYLSEKCEITYESLDCRNCYKSLYSQNLEDCRDCYF